MDVGVGRVCGVKPKLRVLPKDGDSHVMINNTFVVFVYLYFLFSML